MVVNAFMNNQATCRSAALTGSTHCAKYRTRHHDVQIGRRRDDDCIITTEFQNRFTQTPSDCCADYFAHAGRAGSRNQRNTWIFGHIFSNFIIAIDNA